MQITLRTLEHALQILRMVQIPGLLIGYQRAIQIRHGKAIAYALPQIIRWRGQVDGRDGRRFFFNFLRGEGNRGVQH